MPAHPAPSLRSRDSSPQRGGFTPLDPEYGGGGSVKPSYNDKPKSGFAPARKFCVPSLLPEPSSKFALPPPLKPSSGKPSI